MRCGTVVIGLGLGVMLSGCWDSYGYRHRYGYGYYGGYGTTGVVYNQPQPVPVQGQVVVQGGAVQGGVQGGPVAPVATVQGEGIAGSDGTRGWRVVSQTPDQEFRRITQLAGRASCQVEASTQGELRAVCNNVHLILRFDQQNVYKLCAANTDPGVCAQVWTTIAP
jgi:hypothetical protein